MNRIKIVTLFETFQWFLILSLACLSLECVGYVWLEY